MWFKNLRIYRLSFSPKLSPEDLAARLARRPLAHCGNFEMISRGWVPPVHEGAFVHALERQWLVALGIEQKLLPASVVRQIAQERAIAIEKQQDRKLGRRERRDLFDRVMEELLPRAFPQRRTTWAWIDSQRGWLVIDAGSDARADEFIEILLASVDGLAPRPLQTRLAPSAAMSTWLAEGQAPDGFAFDSDLELRAASRAQSAIRYVHHDLGGAEIAAHIAAGKLVTRLGLTWNEKISFVLTDKLQIKRLAFLDVLKEQAEKTAVSADEQFDADFALMTGELVRMFDDLVLALGGFQET